MTEETPPATPEPTPPVDPVQEPTPVNLAAEAAKGVAPPKPVVSLKDLSQELSPEALKQVQGLIESSNSSAVNGALQKQKEDFDRQLAAGQYMTPDGVKTEVETALQLERDKNAAERNLDKWLVGLGIRPDTEDYNKVATVFKDGLESGAYTNKTLLSEVGVKAVAFAAGVVGAPEATDEKPLLLGGIAHGALEQPSAEYKRGDLDRQVAANVAKALKG